MTALTKETEIVSHRVASSSTSRIPAYVELTKLRISVMVLITFIVAGVLAAEAAGVPLSLTLLLNALAGMFLIAASGNAMNMYWNGTPIF